MRSFLVGDMARIVVALLLTPAAVGAQTVVGSVVEKGTLQPLAGAFVVLQDEAGARRAAVLAGDDGRFVLRAPAPGRYRLVAQLIGYADAESDFLVVGEKETVERTLEVPVRAISLEGIRAEVGKRCRGRPDTELRTAGLWDEARKALEIAAWAESEGALRFELVKRHRELDATTLRVTGMDEVGARGYYAGSPYRSVPAERLEAGGYVQRTPDGQWDHFAPDADVLLSDSFLDTHCFRARTGDDPELVGLGFEPVPGREVPEIEGVLWLDRGTAELRRLEFSYVNLPYPHGRWPQVGGVVEFERLATGVWIVRSWHVRMPHEAARIGGFGGSAAQLELRSLLEEGAMVSRVLTRSGEVLSEAMGATLYGMVTDSTTGAPLAGATVEVVPTDRVATAGPDGAYRLGGLPEGTFEVTVSHPDLDFLEPSPSTREVRLETGRATRLGLRPALSALALEACAQAGSFQDPILLHGTVREPDGGAPVPGAVVRVFGTDTERRVTTDSAGVYVTCVERSEAVTLAAAGPAQLLREPEAGDRTEVRVPTAAVVRSDLTLAPEAMLARAPAAPGRGGHPSSALVGSVRGADDGAPIPGAMVLVRTTDGTPVHSGLTNEAGQFRVPHPDEVTAEYSLSVEHVAYGKVSRDITFRPGDQLALEVLLADRVFDLEPIVVKERRRGLLVDVGFYDRMQRGNGVFVERDEIERRRPSHVTDLLRGRSGVTVVSKGPMKYDIRLTGPVRLRGDCQPAIWVDGIMARDGGEPTVASARGPGKAAMSVQPQLSEIVPPTQIEAVELYARPAGLPAQYGGSNAACGVVVIWTRRGG